MTEVIPQGLTEAETIAKDLATEQVVVDPDSLVQLPPDRLASLGPQGLRAVTRRFENTFRSRIRERVDREGGFKPPVPRLSRFWSEPTGRALISSRGPMVVDAGVSDGPFSVLRSGEPHRVEIRDLVPPTIMDRILH